MDTEKRTIQTHNFFEDMNNIILMITRFANMKDVKNLTWEQLNNSIDDIISIRNDINTSEPVFSEIKLYCQ